MAETKRKMVYFGDKTVERSISDFSEKKGISFSRAVGVLAQAGTTFYDSFQTLNVELVKERMENEKLKTELARKQGSGDR